MPGPGRYIATAADGDGLVRLARGGADCGPGGAAQRRRAILANLHGPRRPRVCPRKVKSPLSRWNKHPDGKPRANYRITGITAHVDPSYHQPATRRRKSVTNAAGP